MTVIKGTATAKIGEASNNKEDITNLKRVVWERMPRRHTPQTVMNTVTPVGWNRPHKYVIGELHCLSEAYHAFYHNGSGNKAYIVEDGENAEIPYFVVELKDVNGATWTATFTGVIPDQPVEGVSDGEDMLMIYPFSAKKVVITPPT
jgi:hypothetical protein